MAITIEKGKLVIRPDYITDGEEVHGTVMALLYMLRAMDDDFVSKPEIHQIAMLLEEFMPSIEQWQEIIDKNIKRSDTKTE